MEYQKERLTDRINLAVPPSLNRGIDKAARDLNVDKPAWIRIALALAASPGGLALLAAAAGGRKGVKDANTINL